MTEAGGTPAVYRHAETVMGTVVSFQVWRGTCPPRVTQAAIAEACAWLHRVDATFSTWRPESAVSRLRGGELPLEQAPAELSEVLRLCREAHARSDGWFDAWAAPGGVDPTGLVKGWAIEGSVRILAASGVAGALVNGGGDIIGFHHAGPGEPRAPWRIGIRHPWRPTAFAAVLEVREAVATSGSYERGAHLYNPHDRPSGARVASASVTGPSLTFADAFATALCVAGDAGLDWLSRNDGYEAYLIHADGREVATPGVVFADPRSATTEDPAGSPVASSGEL